MSGRSLALTLALVPVCSLAFQQARGGDPRDDNPPVIVHTPIATEQPEGVAVAVEATVTDESAVTVVLGFRTSGAASFEGVPMVRTGGDVFAAEIPAASVVAPGVEYYLAASDGSPLHNTASDPDGAPTALHGFPVASAPARTEAAAAWEPSGGCAAGGGGAWSLVVLGGLARSLGRRSASRKVKSAGASQRDPLPGSARAVGTAGV